MKGPEFSRLDLGLWLERDAEAIFLVSVEGARCLERNLRYKFGEIDLVFEVARGPAVELVFVEVRARSEGGWVSGLESITYPKQRRLSRAVSAYLARYRGKARSARLDVMEASLKRSGRTEWRHIRNVWLP